MIIRPVLIATSDMPSEAYAAPFELALTGSNGIVRFFDSYGMPLEFAPIERLTYTGPVDYRTLDNPWYELYRFLQPIDVPVLAVVVDWVEQSAYGWGGYPLAMVGQYAASRLLTVGTPEALVDDFHAMGLMGHEVSHCMGFGHSDPSRRDILNQGLYDWPECYPSPDMVQAFKVKEAEVRRLSSVGPLVVIQGEPCPRPS